MKASRLRWAAMAAMLVAVPILAQENGDAMGGAPGCGEVGVKFDVRMEKNQKPPTAAPGNAMVYVIEDDTNFQSTPKPTTRVGVDGQWVGATHGNSFVGFEVTPGVHHLCTSWQRNVLLGSRNSGMSAAHFTAEAGGVYYYKVADVFLMGDTGNLASTKLTALDSDEGQLLANQYAMSSSSPKK